MEYILFQEVAEFSVPPDFAYTSRHWYVAYVFG